MSVSPEGGHALFESSASSAAETTSLSHLTESESAASEAVARQLSTSDISHKVPASVTYTDDTVFLMFAMLVNFSRHIFCVFSPYFHRRFLQPTGPHLHTHCNLFGFLLNDYF